MRPTLHARGMDVDPVVGKQLRPGRGSAPRRGSRGSEGRRAACRTRRRRGRVETRARAMRKRHGGDDVLGLEARARRPASRARPPSRGRRAMSMRVTVCRSSTWLPSRDDAVAARLPHLARAEPRILELVDQRLDRRRRACSATWREDRARERETLDALRRPFRADLGARNAPDLLGVGLEEDLDTAACRSGW